MIEKIFLILFKKQIKEIQNTIIELNESAISINKALEIITRINNQKVEYLTPELFSNNNGKPVLLCKSDNWGLVNLEMNFIKHNLK